MDETTDTSANTSPGPSPEMPAPSAEALSRRARRRLRVGPEGFAQRKGYVAPLFSYFREHGLVALWAARRASARATGVMMTKVQLSRIKSGMAPIPDWFIAGMCREINQPIEVVMGHEWAQQHLPSLPSLPEMPRTTKRRAS